MNNTKNPTALWFQRMNAARKGNPGELARLMTNFFKSNYADVSAQLPKTVADFMIFDQLVAVGNSNLKYFSGAYSNTRSNMPAGNFQLPQSEHAIITGFKVLTGAGATVQATDWVAGVIDPIIKNGTMSCNINGQTVLTQLPFTAFDSSALSATVAGLTDPNRGYFYFYEPLVWLGQTSLTIETNFQSAVATANMNLRIELLGTRFIGN